MVEYIKKSTVIAKFIYGDGDDEFTIGYNFAVNEYREKIKAMQSSDVQPVKRGHWIEVTPRHSKCSICDTTCLIAVYPISKNANYCPNCGARMDGDDE